MTMKSSKEMLSQKITQKLSQQLKRTGLLIIFPKNPHLDIKRLIKLQQTDSCFQNIINICSSQLMINNGNMGSTPQSNKEFSLGYILSGGNSQITKLLPKNYIPRHLINTLQIAKLNTHRH